MEALVKEGNKESTAEDSLDVLLFLASRLSRVRGELETTTGEMAAEMKLSQQTISRKLRLAEENNLVKRKVTSRGVTLALTVIGLDFLRHYYYLLEQFFSGEKFVKVVGQVQKGLGEGRFYMAQEEYAQQFFRLLDFKPYQGTLNLKVKEEELVRALARQKGLKINGFVTEERSFGNILCYPLKIKSGNKEICGAIIFPERSSHKHNLVEVIAPLSLREEWGLKENSEVVLQF